MSTTEITGYRYDNAEASVSHRILLPTVFRHLDDLKSSGVLIEGGGGYRLFEVGCGNGSVANQLAARGWNVTGIDPSIEGIEQAKKAFPGLNLNSGSAYEDLARRFGTFPVVLSLEVVEHVYAPRDYAKTVFDLLEPGGIAILSTPYHGYWKNLALAVSGKMDAHFTALWDHGHIKFWSMQTLTQLLTEAGFNDVRFERVGRIPALAKSMIAIAKNPVPEI